MRRRARRPPAGSGVRARAAPSRRRRSSAAGQARTSSRTSSDGSRPTAPSATSATRAAAVGERATGPAIRGGGGRRRSATMANTSRIEQVLAAEQVALAGDGPARGRARCPAATSSTATTFRAPSAQGRPGRGRGRRRRPSCPVGVGRTVAGTDRRGRVDDHHVEALLRGAQREALAVELGALVGDRELPGRRPVALGCGAPCDRTAGARMSSCARPAGGPRRAPRRRGAAACPRR